ncbi:putative ABC transporter [Clostridium bornimense]|uniref:Putative ABC transporter n=1 Tax=Clostridium bornimense TaxID=1216932 RepID=W6SJ76_9CLOT|nr:ABC transporter ATP-binding protein [Clostridium bornimense]CDM69735.1 putative ABC transporter [Clostridium bornimense]
MLKLTKYLKPFIGSILAIVMLLIIQATCDLALPEYMSNIVNVGIQQNGIDEAVPLAISETELNKIMLFIDEDDKKVLLDNYEVANKSNLSGSIVDKGVKEYISNHDEKIYRLSTKNKDEKDKLAKILKKPIVTVAALESENLADMSAEESPMMQLPEGVDIFTAMSSMPKEQVESMKTSIDEKFSDLPDMMIDQMAVSYVGDQYKNMGVDTDTLRLRYILFEGALMLGIALASMVATVLVGLIGARVAAALGRNLRGKVFNKVIGFSNAEFDSYSTSSLITRTTNDIQQIQLLMVMLLRIVFYAPILGVGGAIKVINTHTSMGWIVVVALVAISLLVMVLFGFAMPKFKLVQKLVDKLNLVSRESLTGMLVIRAFSNQKHEEERFEDVNKELTGTNLFVSRIMVTMMPLMMLIMNLVTILIVWVGAHKINDGIMQVGDMTAFMQYTMQVIMAFLMISMISIMLPRASVSAQRVCEVLDTEESIKDSKNAKTFSDSVKGVVEYKNVSFKYPGAEEYVLKDISFTAKPGETTAFIGSTGSGKSTVINLLPRFYDVTEGEILVDGINIKDVTQHDLREKIGYVPQKGILFSGDIESNLKYGYKNATEEDLKEATEIAQATEFISSKPDGFKTEISQGGTNVSGGQKQRLSIARALIKKPEIYIFDDSFSALDLKTDAALRKALNKKTKNSTILLVAQRVSTIINADQIVVMDEGKVAGIGTHNELMKNCEVYKQIALSQLSKEELANE